MERTAEINGFAIFLFCLLIPLGSLAPTETSENEMITGQRQKRSTTKIPLLAAMVEKEARELFEFYQRCVSPTLYSRHDETFRSKAKAMVKRIPECPAFHANCCALHHISHILETLESEIVTICNETSTEVIEANRNQLRTALKEKKALYTCGTDNLSQLYPQVQTMDLVKKKTYIWGVLEKYENIMRSTNSPNTEAKA